MRELSDINILGIKPTKTAQVFEDIFQDILSRNNETPADFIGTAWDQYGVENTRLNRSSNGLNGKVFETLIACLLYRENIKPIFVEANIAFIPNVTFDLVLYAQDIGPIVLSLKTSLRERYKQADLEGMFLRNVHRKAQSYLITMDAKAASSVNQKIRTGHVLGLDKVIYAGGNDLTQLIGELKQLYFHQTSHD